MTKAGAVERRTETRKFGVCFHGYILLTHQEDRTLSTAAAQANLRFCLSINKYVCLSLTAFPNETIKEQAVVIVDYAAVVCKLKGVPHQTASRKNDAAEGYTL